MRRLAAIALFQVPGAIALALIALLQANTLASSGTWTSTKSTLARGVIGATRFVTGHHATKQNALDLGAWHGHQEVILNRPITATTRRISFSVSLADGAYVCFLFNKDGRGFSGLRLSRNARYPHLLFTADAAGRFLSRQVLALSATLASDRARAVALERDGDRLVLSIDARREQRVAATLAPGTRIGFRGSARSAVVDDVVIFDREAKVFTEDFFNRRGLGAWALAGFLLLSLVSGAGARLLRLRLAAGGARRPLFALLTLHLVLAAMLGMTAVALYSLQGRSYPLAVDLKAYERQWALQWAEEVRRHIRETYAAAPAAGAYRILFVGSSQTWGAGAARLQDVFATQVGRKLDLRLAGRGLATEIINAGISGLDSRVLIGEYYLSDWIHLAPHLVVVNLSNNDAYETADFPRNLELLVRANQQRGIATLLVKEPRSLEAGVRDIAVNHAKMQAVADAHGVLCLDMQRLYAQRYDDGFFFWDSVHLTSFGQTFVADRLAETIWREFLAAAQRPGTAAPPGRGAGPVGARPPGAPGGRSRVDTPPTQPRR